MNCLVKQDWLQGAQKKLISRRNLQTVEKHASRKDCQDPRRQAEVLLYEAIQRAMVAYNTTQPPETARSAAGDATGRGQRAHGSLQPLQAQEACNQTAAV